jgi:hypothetical protein
VATEAHRNELLAQARELAARLGEVAARDEAARFELNRLVALVEAAEVADPDDVELDGDIAVAIDDANAALARARA